ncbi:MAG: hypothetical protein ABIF71_11445, partial [Planctomycetota bacterium]
MHGGGLPAQGNITQTRNEEGHDFFMEYDSLGRLSRKYGTVSGGNAGFDVSFVYTVDVPKRTSKNKILNNVSGAWQEEHLGCCGRVYKTLESIKQGQYSQETRTYYLGDGKVGKVTYPDGRISETAFDELDRPVTEKRNGDSLLSIAYDENPAIYDTRLSGLHCGSVVQTTDAMGSTTRTIRDGLGRTLREIDARNYPTVSYPAEYTATHTDYLGGHIPVWVSRVIDARSVPTKIAHDMLCREVSRGVDPLGLALASEAMYDFGGRKTRDIAYNDTVAQVTVYAFNARNLLESATYPDGGAKTFTYYADGQLEETIDQSGNHILNVRDQLDRVTAVYYQDSSLNDKMRDVFSYYDAANRIDSFRYVNNVLTSEARIYNNDLGQILQERQRHYLSGYESAMNTINSDFLIPVGWTDGFPERVWRIFRVTNGLRRLSFLGSDFRMIGHAPD